MTTLATAPTAHRPPISPLMISGWNSATGVTSRCGYRALILDASGQTAVPLYGRTPGELHESIRMAEREL